MRIRIHYSTPLTEWVPRLDEVLCISPSVKDGDPSYSGFDEEEEWL